MSRWDEFRFHPRIFWLWGNAALWHNVQLYGHRFRGDTWLSRWWKTTRYGGRVWAERQRDNVERQRKHKERHRCQP